MNNNFFTHLIFHSGRREARRAKPARGQSLVELALTLPVLLTLVAGIVEVTNLLTIYNQVQLVAREGARYAAEGGSDGGLMNIITQASSNQLSVTSGRMTVWVIRPVINTSVSPANPSTPSTWTWSGGSQTTWGVTENCVFPTGCTDASPVTPNKVLTDLANITDSQASGVDGTRFSIVVVSYQASTILGMRVFNPSANGLYPMWAYSIMRQEVDQQAVSRLDGGCSAYPIAISDTAFPDGVAEKTQFSAVLNSETGGELQDGFRFLSWQKGQETSTYVTGSSGSLVPPGNSLTMYQEYGDPDDTTLHRGDWVVYNLATVTNASTLLTADIGTSPPRTLRVIVYSPEVDVNPGLYDYGSGQDWMYRIDNFAVVRIAAINAASNTITFEFVSWDASCGFSF